MRTADSAVLSALGGAHSRVLIERAGTAVANVAMQMMGGAYGRRVIVIAGKGNNGADGRVAAQRLRLRGATVCEMEADQVADEFIDSRRVDLVIDAAYGIGFRGTWQPPVVFDVPVLAVDLPSGLDADDGSIAGGILVADRTVTFAALKPGQLLGDGPAVCGAIDIADIGVDVLEHVDDVSIFVVEPGDVAPWIPPRARDGHKWQTAVRIVAGSSGMFGSAALASVAAMRAGAGIVHLSSRSHDNDVAYAVPTEVVSRPLPNAHWSTAVTPDLSRFRSLVIGPGLGRGDDIAHEIREVVRTTTVPVVIDGDGLAAVVDAHGDASCLAATSSTRILTPHDGEFATLGGDVASDRVGATRSLAQRLGCVLLRKGPTTIITDGVGPTLLVVSGDERLATAGSGDVLSGIIGAFLARGLDAVAAAAAGAVVHGLAAQLCQREGVIARDVAGNIADVLSELGGVQ